MALCSERSSSAEAEVEVRCWPTGAIVMRNRRDAYRCGTIAQSHNRTPNEDNSTSNGHNEINAEALR
jgi:hypothetical protein